MLERSKVFWHSILEWNLIQYILSPTYQWWTSLTFLADCSINLMFWKTECVWFNKEISFKHFSVLNFHSFSVLFKWFAFFQMLTFFVLTSERVPPRLTSIYCFVNKKGKKEVWFFSREQSWRRLLNLKLTRVLFRVT